MPAVLTASTTVDCGHGGKIGVAGSPVLSVQSAGVLLKTGIETKLVGVPPCGIVPPPASNLKCSSVTAVTGTFALKLTVQSQPVVLMSLTGTTNGNLLGVTPQPLLKAIGAQTKLTAV